MLLSTIKSSGEGAARQIAKVNAIKTICNTYAPSYDEELAAVRVAFNNIGLTFATMTDEQILAFSLNGIGDAEAIAIARQINIEQELCIVQVKSSADKFINDI